MMPAGAYIAEAGRMLVLVVLAAAAWTKTADLGGFAASLSDHFRVPARASRPLAVGIAALEWLAAALLLAGGRATRAGLVLAAGLLLAFTVVLAEALLRGRQAYCSCFGRTRHPLALLDLARNGFYLSACAFGLLVVTPASLGWVAQAALLLVAVFCFLVSSHLEDLRQLH
jgi:methylamine utilization protein MauE